MLRQAAEKTGEAVGDGTSTATILAHAIYTDGIRNVMAGASAIDLSHGDASYRFMQSAGAAANGGVIVGSWVLLDNKYIEPANPRDAVILRYKSLWKRAGLGNDPSHFGWHA